MIPSVLEAAANGMGWWVLKVEQGGCMLDACLQGGPLLVASGVIPLLIGSYRSIYNLYGPTLYLAAHGS